MYYPRYSAIRATTPTPVIPSTGAGSLVEWVRTGESEAGVLTGLLLAAQGWAEGICDTHLFAGSFRVDLSAPTNGTLPGANLSTITVQLKTDGTYADAPDDHYTVEGDTVTFAEGLTEGVYRITYNAGYDEASLPYSLRLALLFYVAYSYDNRANPVAERFTAGEALLRPFRYYSIA